MPAVLSQANSIFNNQNVGKAITGNTGHFPSPFLDMASLAMPEQNKNVLEWCFVPGTLIELGDHTLKPIEEMQKGDEVLTRGGTIESVVKTSRRKFSGQLVDVKFSGMTGLGGNFHLGWRVTENHNVQAIPAPRGRNKRPDISKARKIAAGNLKPGDYVATPVPISTNFSARTNALAASPQTARYSGWLAGMYLAEACPIWDACDSSRILGV